MFKKTIHGGFWVFALKIATEALSFIRYIILANLLGVESFGILGAAMLMVSITQTFTEMGFNTVLVLKKDDILKYLNSVWVAAIARGFILYVFIYFAAPFIQYFKIDSANINEAVLALRIVSLKIIMDAFMNPGIIYFQKDMKFNKQFILNIFSTISGIIITISIAIVYKNIWALVAGVIFTSCSKTVFSYYLHSYRPSFRFSFKDFFVLWQTGKWLTLGSILNFILTQGDDLFVGAYLGADFLGLYQMAYRLSNIPATEITRVASQVIFPAFSKIQDSLDRLKDAYFKSLQFISLVAFPIAFLVCAAADEFVHLFMKEEWKPIIIPIKILAVYGLLRSVKATRGNIYYIFDKVRLNVTINVFKMIYFVLLLYPLTKHFGINGTSLCIVIVSVSFEYIDFYFLKKIMNISIYRFYKPFYVPFMACIIMVAFYGCAKIYFDEISMLKYAGMVIVSGVAYIVSIIVLNKLFKYRIIEDMIEIKNKIA